MYLAPSLYGMPAGAGRKGGKAPRKKAAAHSVPTNENYIPLQNINITQSNKLIM